MHWPENILTSHSASPECASPAHCALPNVIVNACATPRQPGRPQDRKGGKRVSQKTGRKGSGVKGGGGGGGGGVGGGGRGVAAPPSDWVPQGGGGGVASHGWVKGKEARSGSAFSRRFSAGSRGEFPEICSFS